MIHIWQLTRNIFIKNIYTNYGLPSNTILPKMSLTLSQTLDFTIQKALDTFNQIQTETPKYAVYTNDIFQTDEFTLTKHEINKRKSVEYNGMELLSALMLLYPGLSCENVFSHIGHIVQHGNPRLIIKPDDIAQYAADLTHKKGMITEYIPAFYRDIGVMAICPEDIVAVYLTGKYQTFPEIIALNSGVDHKTAKADVYIKMPDRMIGLSVKQSQDATKTNYSIHKLLPSVVAEKLTQIKRDFLVSKGFPDHDKTKRNEVNQLFYPETPERPTNPYFRQILTEIEANNPTVLDGILGPLFCRNIPYHMFEYDGDRIIQLNIDAESLATARLEHHIPYYYDKKGGLRQCAKMFFRLTVGDKVFRAELRWKGNIHAASPQFQLFSEK